ncbi:hypothetical protein ACEPPN_017960 [Leptodophora sp. 'Broadleaf-Isolate-01']
MGPGTLRKFDWYADQPRQPGLRPGESRSNRGEFRTGTPLGVERYLEMSLWRMEQSLMEDEVLFMVGTCTWNARLHGPLEELKVPGDTTSLPDRHFHKNRDSGMCDRMAALADYLR